LDWKKYVKLDKDKIRPNEVVKLVCNPSKAVEKLGWKPDRMSFKDHVKMMCEHDYLLENGFKPNRPNVFSFYS
jgi:GDPmannose 4,6-dehydratase